MSITVQQPQPYDLVGDVISVAGIAGGAFEAAYNYVISEAGEPVTSGHFMAGSRGHRQFQVEVDISSAGFTQEAATLHVFHVPPTDEGIRTDEVVVPILLGRQIVSDYGGYGEYVVEPGDTLSGIAAAHLGSASRYPLLVAANVHTIPNPDVIEVGQLIRIPLPW